MWWRSSDSISSDPYVEWASAKERAHRLELENERRHRNDDSFLLPPSSSQRGAAPTGAAPRCAPPQRAPEEAA